MHTDEAESPYEGGEQEEEMEDEGGAGGGEDECADEEESAAEEESATAEGAPDEVWDTDPRHAQPSADPPLKAENACGRWVLLPVSFWPAMAKAGLVGWQAEIVNKTSRRRGNKYICRLSQEQPIHLGLDQLKQCKMLS